MNTVKAKKNECNKYITSKFIIDLYENAPEVEGVSEKQAIFGEKRRMETLCHFYNNYEESIYDGDREEAIEILRKICNNVSSAKFWIEVSAIEIMYFVDEKKNGFENMDREDYPEEFFQYSKPMFK